MRYLAVSFLRWVVTSCVMWGLPTCLSTPSFAASFPRVDLRGAVVHRAHLAPLDLRALVARQVHRVQAALRDRVVAVDPPVRIPEADLDPKEALAPPGKAAAQGAADTLVPVATQAAADHRARAVHLAAPVHPAVARRVVARKADLQVVQGRKVAQVQVAPVAQAAHPVRSHQGAVVQAVVDHQQAVHRAVVPLAVQEPKVARDLAAQVVAAQVGVDHRAVRKAAHRVGPAVNPVQDRSQDRSQVRSQVRSRDHSRDHKAAANRPAQAPVHRDPVAVFQVPAALAPVAPALAVNHLVAAMAVALDQAGPGLARVQVAVPVPDRVVVDRVALAPADQDPADQDLVVSVPVALAVQGNRMALAVIAVARRAAAAALVQQVGVAARVTTSGTDLAGWPLLCRIRASFGSARFRPHASVRGMSRPAPAPMSDKPFTQDASKVRYDQTY